MTDIKYIRNEIILFYNSRYAERLYEQLYNNYMKYGITKNEYNV